MKNTHEITASSVAEYIVWFFQEHQDLITNLKLQKLLYYVQGWYLGINDKSLFDEDFEAWVHGPVCSPVYQKYKDYHWNPILKEANKVTFSVDINNHIDEVLEVYGGDTAWSLEMRTHQETPWIIARGGLSADESSNAIITKESMRDFFANLAKNN